MRWEKLAPLIAKVDQTYNRARAEIEAFVRFIEGSSGSTRSTYISRSECCVVAPLQEYNQNALSLSKRRIPIVLFLRPRALFAVHEFSRSSNPSRRWLLHLQYRAETISQPFDTAL